MATQEAINEAINSGNEAMGRGVPRRPRLRDDGIPTRADMRYWTLAEDAIALAMRAVEAAGASLALTDAVNLLSNARDRVADHVEGNEPGHPDGP